MTQTYKQHVTCPRCCTTQVESFPLNTAESSALVVCLGFYDGPDHAFVVELVGRASLQGGSFRAQLASFNTEKGCADVR